MSVFLVPVCPLKDKTRRRRIWIKPRTRIKIREEEKDRKNCLKKKENDVFVFLVSMKNI